MGVAGPLRLGLLSTAHVNRHLLATRGEQDAVAIVAVGSRERTRAEAYAREHGIPLAHGSYEELLADPEVEAVYVALPNALHHEWTLRALAAGKHVLCEKPYSRLPHEVEEAFDAAEAAGLVLAEAYMWRHHPQTRLLLELLPELGELRAIRSTFCFRLDRPGDVRLDPALGGGALLDVGCYCVGASRLLAGGEPDEVHGVRVLRGGVDVQFTGVLRFGEVTAEFTCGFGASHRGLEAIGSEGSLATADPWHGATGVVVLDGREIPFPRESAYRHELEDFAAAVRGGAEPLLSRADALGQSRTLAALLAAAA